MRYLDFLLTAPHRLVNYLENLSIPLINYFLSFISIIILRNFLEGFSHSYLMNLFFANYAPTFLAGEFIHFSLFYSLIACLLTITLYGLTKEKIINIIKVLLPAFIIILFVPVIDLITSAGKGHPISYVFPNPEHNLFYYYYTFLSSTSRISLGIRLEIFIVMLGTFLYLRVKQKNILTAIIGSILAYTVIFFVGTTPYPLQVCAKMFDVTIEVNSKTAITYLLLLLFPSGVGISLLANKKIFIALIKDLRWLRLLHFELMLLLGITLAAKYFNIFLIPNFILLSISTMFFWLFAIMTNNIIDQPIDCISNPQRPLITKEINVEQYKNIACVVLSCSLVYALAVNTISLIIISSVTVAAGIYSLPPLRLKRVPILSKSLISLVSLAFVFLGYINVRGSWIGFPQTIIWIFLIGFTLAINFIDIKDYMGDKANCIMTLPVLLTPPITKLLAGIAFILTALAFHFYLQNPYLLPALLAAGVLGCYFINQKNYQEWRIFSVYLVIIASLIAYILIKNLSS